MKRQYFGSVSVDKVYRGAKTINLVLGKQEGLELAKFILSAMGQQQTFDLAVYDYRKKKNGKIQMTVTSPVRGE